MPPSLSSDPTAATGEQVISTGRFKPLVSIRNHKWLALFIMFTITAAGLPVAWYFGKPLYIVQSIVMVSPRFVPNLDDKDSELDLHGNDYQLFIEQQERLVKHRSVLEKALEMPEVQKMWMKHPDDADKEDSNSKKKDPKEKALDKLQDALATSSKSRKSPFITISLIGNQAEGLDKVLNIIVDIYLKKSQAASLYNSDIRIDILKQRSEQITQSIAKKVEQRTKIAEGLGVTTFKESSLNPYDSILIESTSTFKLAQRKRVEAQALLDSLERDAQGQSILETLVREQVATNSTLDNYKSKLIDRRTELLSQVLGMTAENPSRRRVEQEVAKIDNDIAKATNVLTEDIRQRLLAQRRAEVFQARQVESALQIEVEKQRDQASHYSTLYNEALSVNRELERAYKQLNIINNRVDSLSLEVNAPGFVRLDSKAQPPDFSVGLGRKKIFFLFIFAALGLGIVVPILVDLLDRRIRTPGEVHKILGFAPLAWILERENPQVRQLAVDQLRRLALALEREWRTQQNNYFVLTSVKPGGGTTTLTLEIARNLSILGVRAIAIELNAFKPDPRYQGALLSKGLMGLLQPEGAYLPDIRTLIVPATDNFNLPDRLPVGDAPERHLTTYGKLSTVLQQLSNYYDVILLDSPPILLSADAELSGEIEGGILLVIEAGQVNPGELKRAVHLLERLTPPVFAAIMNRVPIYQGGGYFADLIKEYVTGSKLRPHWFKRLFWK